MWHSGTDGLQEEGEVQNWQLMMASVAPIRGVEFGEKDTLRLKAFVRRLLRLPDSLRPMFHTPMPRVLPALRPRLCKADLEVLVNLLRYPWVPDLHSHLAPLPINRHDGHMHLHGPAHILGRISKM